MTKKYFDKPCLTLVRMTRDVIVTSPDINNAEGHVPLAPELRESIWDIY